jgi:hypothetical protein
MKKLLILALIGASAQAGMYSIVSGMSMDEIKPKAVYTIDTAGVNPRIYEFTTKTSPKKACILVVVGDEPTLQCTVIK